MIPNFKTFIGESIWGDLARRSGGDKLRAEDKLCNLYDLKPIDMGGSVLWANEDLCYSDEYHFGYSEVFEYIKNSEWRLPTRKDIDELDRYCVLKSNKDCLYFTNKSQVLTFNRNGMIYNTSVSHGNEIVTYLSEYWGWTSEEVGDGTIHCFIITDNDILYSPLNSHSTNHSIGDIINTDKTAKLCVRLVKDK